MNQHEKSCSEAQWQDYKNVCPIEDFASCLHGTAQVVPPHPPGIDHIIPHLCVVLHIEEPVWDCVLSELPIRKQHLSEILPGRVVEEPHVNLTVNPRLENSYAAEHQNGDPRQQS